MFLQLQTLDTYTTSKSRLTKPYINKDILRRKPNKENGVLILDRKLYYNAIQEQNSGTSKFEKLNEDPTLKREASLEFFLRKLKRKHFFNKNVYDKLHPSVSAPAPIHGNRKMHRFSSGDFFLNLVRLFHL